MLGKASLGLLALGALLNQAAAHSWVDAIDNIGSNGTFVGATGYPRGYVSQTTPNFNDITMVNLIPPDGRPGPNPNEILPTELMCKDTQTTYNQTAGFPRLQAAPGAKIAIRYQENGHVTLPQNQPGKPDNRGTIYIYGTSEPKATDTYLGIQGQWNAAGTGGDRRGKLIATQNFDDGQCYQINSGSISAVRQQEFPIGTPTQPEGANLWCQNIIPLPQDLPTGKPYTLYWVWVWPTAPGTPGLLNGKNEAYTTCLDIDIQTGNAMTAGSGTNKAANVGQSAGGQSRNSLAVPALLKALSGGSAPTAVAPAADLGPASTTMATTAPAAAGPATAAYSAPYSTPSAPMNTAGSMTTIVVPVTTLMTTVVQAASAISTPITAPPVSPFVGMIPGSTAPVSSPAAASASAPAASAPTPPIGSNCTAGAGQKRSKIFRDKVLSRQSFRFATN